MNKAKQIFAYARNLWGPLGYIAFVVTAPIWLLFMLLFNMSTFITGIAPALVKGIVGKQAATQYEEVFNKALYVISVGTVLFFALVLLEELTNGWHLQNLPDWVIGYSIYVATLLVAVGIYVGIVIVGAVLLTRFPILQYVLAAIVLLIIVASISSPTIRDCETTWTMRGPVCE